MCLSPSAELPVFDEPTDSRRLGGGDVIVVDTC
jgi:hypothetical protein